MNSGVSCSLSPGFSRKSRERICARMPSVGHSGHSVGPEQAAATASGPVASAGTAQGAVAAATAAPGASNAEPRNAQPGSNKSSCNISRPLVLSVQLEPFCSKAASRPVALPPAVLASSLMSMTQSAPAPATLERCMRCSALATCRRIWASSRSFLEPGAPGCGTTERDAADKRPVEAQATFTAMSTAVEPPGACRAVASMPLGDVEALATPAPPFCSCAKCAERSETTSRRLSFCKRVGATTPRRACCASPRISSSER
mmetsp:Transcript_25223/g.54953  ORF Transcript_25223/g.54953 Transcript_25223/m.54953 type:complete len:259 (+) Transcript_25223:350-1126(+)